MLTLTYSNTFADVTGTEQTTTNRVLVSRQSVAYALIQQWNANSKDHCKQRYHYEILSLEPATKQEVETLNVY